MDPLQSGAIFRLKNVSVLHVKTKPTEVAERKREAPPEQDSNPSSVPNLDDMLHTDFTKLNPQAHLIQNRFEKIYRSTVGQDFTRGPSGYPSPPTHYHLSRNYSNGNTSNSGRSNSNSSRGMVGISPASAATSPRSPRNSSGRRSPSPGGADRMHRMERENRQRLSSSGIGGNNGVKRPVGRPRLNPAPTNATVSNDSTASGKSTGRPVGRPKGPRGSTGGGDSLIIGMSGQSGDNALTLLALPSRSPGDDNTTGVSSSPSTALMRVSNQHSSSPSAQQLSLNDEMIEADEDAPIIKRKRGRPFGSKTVNRKTGIALKGEKGVKRPRGRPPGTGKHQKAAAQTIGGIDDDDSTDDSDYQGQYVHKESEEVEGDVAGGWRWEPLDTVALYKAYGIESANESKKNSNIDTKEEASNEEDSALSNTELWQRVSRTMALSFSRPARSRRSGDILLWSSAECKAQWLLAVDNIMKVTHVKKDHNDTKSNSEIENNVVIL
jgi:hypothetical protein